MPDPWAAGWCDSTPDIRRRRLLERVEKLWSPQEERRKRGWGGSVASRGNDSAKRLRGAGGSSLSMDSSGCPNCTVFGGREKGKFSLSRRWLPC